MVGFSVADFNTLGCVTRILERNVWPAMLSLNALAVISHSHCISPHALPPPIPPCAVFTTIVYMVVPAEREKHRRAQAASAAAAAAGAQMSTNIHIPTGNSTSGKAPRATPKAD